MKLFKKPRRGASCFTADLPWQGGPTGWHSDTGTVNHSQNRSSSWKPANVKVLDVGSAKALERTLR
jgi:hypothetical protein